MHLATKLESQRHHNLNRALRNLRSAHLSITFCIRKSQCAESCGWDVFSSYSKLVKVHFSHAFSRFSNCCYARSAHLPCLPARRDVRQLGSLLANRERYRIRSRRSCAVCGSRVFVCALHLHIRGAWFCCKECFRSLRPEVLLVHGI